MTLALVGQQTLWNRLRQRGGQKCWSHVGNNPVRGAGDEEVPGGRNGPDSPTRWRNIRLKARTACQTGCSPLGLGADGEGLGPEPDRDQLGRHRQE
ncbi:hypothetical protein NDU88_003104 [Pleurodeles waltl]|uniref:Uncharacterized protein n=1 Tax=Pleurodeles waltl TaxID=8319 RepID=A0AAV7QAU8_PLEWA|nr:hypothetical protein NDU88_003104 [Pleurodeles waltl]